MLQLTDKERVIVEKILQRHVPQHAVWAFGSRVTGTTKKTADLDLAIISEQPLSLELQAALREDFDNSLLPFKVDIVDWATTSESFRQIVQKNKFILKQGAF